ncbi:MAG: nicotinate mononucleotide-dependent phosphoribosyltransferase CobT [Prochlorotrichaceae cyanobacterium]|jgi:uncharacterized protein (TIGR00303 family)
MPQPILPSPVPDLPIILYGCDRRGEEWIDRYRGCSAHLICTLGFTATGLVPHISAAGKTPNDRRYTALADAEFLFKGITARNYRYPLPPLSAGISPVLLTRALWEAFQWPLSLVNAGLPETPSVPAIDVQGVPAQCLSSGKAMSRHRVRYLLNQGMHWGEQFALNQSTIKQGNGYLILGECVVGGTTTALGILMGLGYDALGLVNSSHPICNHDQKKAIVQAGLQRANLPSYPDPLDLLAAVGDPMQVFVAGMTLTASRQVGILLAGGTQMMATYALTAHIAKYYGLDWQPQQVLIGTTRWVTEDPSSDALGLLTHLSERLDAENVPSLAVTQLSFQNAPHPGLADYEQGYVKEGMAAGGTAIAASVSGGWQQADLQQSIYAFVDRYQASCL